MLKKTLYFLILSFLLFSCNTKENIDEKNTSKIFKASEMKVDERGLSITKAILKTVHGNIVFKFYPKEAPNTVTRIIILIRENFYNGLKFHRVIPNFVIQTGDPNGTGTGGSGQKLKGEFNSIQHIKGTVAMARAKDPDSADSQFYISLNTLPHLDGNYTVFGQVTDGLNVLEKITRGDKIINLTLIEGL